MKGDSRDTGRLAPLLRAVSLFIAIGLFGAGCSGFMSSKAQHAEQKTDTEMKADMKMTTDTKMEMATTGIFDGVGEIIALLPEKTQVVVGHEEIKGFMKAMPMGMGYDVESLDLLKGLKPGDRVKFKVDAGKKKIVSIEPLQ